MCATPTLYLDFDGVLHPTSGGDDRFFSCSDILSQALEGRVCALVISSSWRHHYTLEAIRRLLPNPLSNRIVGTTGDAYIGKFPRYNEIVLDAKRRDTGATWRALDDSWIEFPPACPELIRCNPNYGIQAAEATALVAWLDTIQIKAKTCDR